MTGRSIPSAMATALQQPFVSWFPLVHLALDSGDLYISGAPFDVEYDGHTWITLHGLGSIEAISETDTSQQGLAFTLSGVPSAAIALALTEHVQQRPVTVRLAAVDANGALQVDDSVWQGLLDVMSFEEGDAPRLRVTAEHRLTAWDEPSGLMYSHEDQQQLHPGDRFFEHTASLVEATILWPSRAAQGAPT